jgi:DNA repair ATPase RecN
MDQELSTALAEINRKLDTMQIQISGLPLMAASLHELREDVREMRRETRLMKAAINDMARINITGGEVEALHDEPVCMAVGPAPDTPAWPPPLPPSKDD